MSPKIILYKRLDRDSCPSQGQHLTSHAASRGLFRAGGCGRICPCILLFLPHIYIYTYIQFLYIVQGIISTDTTGVYQIYIVATLVFFLDRATLAATMSKLIYQGITTLAFQ